MSLLLLGVAVVLAGALAALAASRFPRLAVGLAAASSLLGGALGLVPAARVLLGGPTETLRLPWQVPYGAFYLELDPLSAFFLLPVLGLSGILALHGAGHLLALEGRRSPGPPSFFYNLLVASMVVLVLARNAVLFLFAWEVMALASFFLLTFEDEKKEVREAGWTYLVATHLGTAFLIALFVTLGSQAGSLDFDRLAATAPGPRAGLFFLLAVVGFGAKVGLAPFHVWLPEAYPAAPSHVSALMSGVMMKTGIYGLLRSLTFLGHPHLWWGWLLVGLGLASGILGIVFALAQKDLKRLLAYSSVENAGIIVLAIGLGLMGISLQSPPLAVLGLGGALLHVLNHALMKGLLFLGAGSVLDATGTSDMERLGGLQKKMPWTGGLFLVGAAAISALPPLNGFAGEFLIYLGAFEGARSLPIVGAVPALAVVAGLALIGGLTAACFAKAFGFVFLGQPRSAAMRIREPGLLHRIPMALLALGCLLVGLAAPLVPNVLAPVLGSLAGVPAGAGAELLAVAGRPLALVEMAVGAWLGILAVLALFRMLLLRKRRVDAAGTWDCGYALPTPRMQYTSSSFSRPLTDLFGWFLRPRRALLPPRGPFPSRASLSTETPDVCREAFYRPVLGGIGRCFARLHWLQHGEVQLYVLYIAVTMLLLLVWKLGVAA